MQFTVLLCLTLVIFIIAVARQTIGTLLLSSLMWLALSFITYAVSDPTSGLTQGSAGVFFLLFILMLGLSFKASFDKLTESATEQQRKMVEGDEVL